MSDRQYPNAVEILTRHSKISGGFLWHCLCGVDWDTDRDVSYEEHVADAWRQACTVDTLAALTALPHGTIVQSDDGTVACLWRYALPLGLPDDLYGHVFGDSVYFPWRELALPAVIIHHPDWR